MGATYKLKARRGTLSGALYFGYNSEGYLIAFDYLFNAPLNAEQRKWLSERFPWCVEDLPKLTDGFVLEDMQKMTAREKLIVFCNGYKASKKTTYSAKQAEKANIKTVQVNEELMKAYFNHTNYPLNVAKSINDYIRHFNFVKDLAANGTPKTNRKAFPEHYDRNYEYSLKGDEITAYHKHLRALGWESIYSPAGGTTWKAPGLLPK